VNRAVGREQASRLPSVIDTLTAGYETINRRLWLVLLPIALDLLFWLGPKLSVVRLAGYLPLAALSPDQVASAGEVLGHLNLAYLLALYVPSVLGRAIFDPIVPAQLWERRLVYQVAPETFVVALVVLVPLGLLVAAFYLGQIGQLVRPASAAGGGLRAIVRHWWRLVVVHAAGLLVFACLAAPAAALIAAANAFVSRDIAGFLLLLFQVTLLWLGVYYFFALGATILSDDSPVRAALSSADLVRTNFWAAMALVGLILIIETGLSLVWRLLAGQTWSAPWGTGGPALGLALSIVANAYVGTGLAAAAMIFYRDRFLVAQQRTSR